MIDQTAAMTLPCPHCEHPRDMTGRMHGDRVWCHRCGNWYAVVMRLDGSVYLVKCDAPIGAQV